jgi:hypothetical protein
MDKWTKVAIVVVVIIGVVTFSYVVYKYGWDKVKAFFGIKAAS